VKSEAVLVKNKSSLSDIFSNFVKNFLKKLDTVSVGLLVSFLNSKVQFESPTMVKVKISTGAGECSTE